MSLAALSASVLLPDGAHCRYSEVHPDETVSCDIAWSLSQAELELGETFVQITVQGNDTGSSAASLNFTTAAAVPVPQAPAMTVKLEQAEPPSALVPGVLSGTSAPVSIMHATSWFRRSVMQPHLSLVSKLFSALCRAVHATSISEHPCILPLQVPVWP